MLLNTRESFGLIAQVLHWTTAVLILILVPLGIYMYELPVATGDEAAHKFWYYSLHKTLGVTALIVAVLRVAWACVQPTPRSLNSDRKFENLAARTIHWMLYAAIIVMPITGWLHHSATQGFAPIWWPLPQDLPLIPKSPQLAPLFATAHYCTAFLITLSVALHIAGALKHVMIDRDDTLQRMIPGARRVQSRNLPSSPPSWLPATLTLLSFAILTAVIVALYANDKTNPQGNRTATRQAANSGAAWRIDMAKSQLAIQIVQSGKPVTGAFQRWNARINFNPKNLDKARIEVEVDVASLTLGSVSADAISPEFLNAETYPIARFISRKIARTGEQSYEARGELTLAGQTRPLTLPFNLKIVNARAFATAKIALNRLAFGIGKKGYSGGSLVGIDVLVQTTVEASRAPRN